MLNFVEITITVLDLDIRKQILEKNEGATTFSHLFSESDPL